MKKHHVGALAILGLVVGINTADAQQRPPVVPLPKPPSDLKNIRYPTSPTQYEKVVQWELQIVRTLPQRFHLSQGETDAILLHLKDCASRVEMDGVVTLSEFQYCNNTTMAKVQEALTPIIAQMAGGSNE